MVMNGDVEGESKRMEQYEGETDRNGTQPYTTIRNLDHNHRGLKEMRVMLDEY
jgi:hypothetical protein